MDNNKANGALKLSGVSASESDQGVVVSDGRGYLYRELDKYGLGNQR